MKKETKRFGYMSQDYAAPRAESIEMDSEGVLCASKIPEDGGTTQQINGTDFGGNWDEGGGIMP